MYQLISSMGIASEFNGVYHEIDIGDTPMYSIFNTYTNVLCTLVRLTDNIEVSLDLYALPVGVRLLSQTLKQWLVSNGNKTLPTTDIPEITYEHAKFRDLWEWGFSAKMIARDIHPDYEVADDQKVDVLLFKEGADYRGMCENFLFTVNGFVHQADYIDQGVVLKDAHLSKLVANNTHLGGIDFSGLGGLTIVDITDEMIYKRYDGQPFNQALYIRLPEPVSNRIPMLVLGGYLHALDDTYSMVSDDVMKIDFSRYPWIQRYMTLVQQLDLTELGIEPEINGTYSIEQIASDAVILKLLAMSQTFVVYVNTDELRRGTVAIHHAGLPGVYQSVVKPFAPMVIDDGRMTEYMISTEHGKYAIRAEHYLSDFRVLETTQYLAYSQTAPLNVSERPKEFAHAYFLMLSKTIGD